MQRPISVKPDNFFLLLYRALRQRRVPLTLRLVVHGLLLVLLAVLIEAWVMGMEFQKSSQRQMQSLGQGVIRPTAVLAADFVGTQNTISLNVMLHNLTENSLVAYAVVYNTEGRVVSEAGTRMRNLSSDEPGLFKEPLVFQKQNIGELQILLDRKELEMPVSRSLQSMILLSLILLVLGFWLSVRLGRQLTTPLLQLRAWLEAPEIPAPAHTRQDEIGDLARQLQAHLAPPLPEVDTDDIDLGELEKTPSTSADEADDDLLIDVDDEPPLQAEPGMLQADKTWELDETPVLPPDPPPAPSHPSAVLAIQLGDQVRLRALPRARLLYLLERYRGCLEESARLYGGRIHTLVDGSSLVIFPATQPEYLTHALCCGELMRALGHALQIEIADSGMTLQLQLGLALGVDLEGKEESQLLLSPGVETALSLSQHSRNLVLVDQAVAQDPQVRQTARIRPIASPADASCVERLQDPHPARIERQLAQMHEQYRQRS